MLRRGFAGTSLGDILAATELTKGAFFHHFEGKADLASALVDRYRRNHQALFERFAAEADAGSEDPLEATLAFLKRFEAFIEARTSPLSGCVFASCVHQDEGFDARLRTAVTENLRRWTSIYESRFQAVLSHRKPSIAVTAKDLAEMIVCIIEGGLILSRSYDDAHLVARQSRQFRNYLGLIFADRTPRAGSE